MEENVVRNNVMCHRNPLKNRQFILQFEVYHFYLLRSEIFSSTSVHCLSDVTNPAKSVKKTLIFNFHISLCVLNNREMMSSCCAVDCLYIWNIFVLCKSLKPSRYHTVWCLRVCWWRACFIQQARVCVLLHDYKIHNYSHH